MAMSARERLPEYATLKALGFRPRHVGLLVFAESMAIALTGGVLGIALTFPAAAWFASVVGSILPVFVVEGRTVAMQAGCAAAVGVVAALVPAVTSARVRVVDGLRAVA
jgi:putative ABC transport system permease protein